MMIKEGWVLVESRVEVESIVRVLAGELRLLLSSVFDATDNRWSPSVDPRAEVGVRSYGCLMDSEGRIKDSLVAW